MHVAALVCRYPFLFLRACLQRTATWGCFSVKQIYLQKAKLADELQVPLAMARCALKTHDVLKLTFILALCGH